VGGCSPEAPSATATPSNGCAPGISPTPVKLTKGENIVKWIKGQRISWLGHLERMEEDRMPKKIFTQELEGTRRRGRPMKGQREVEKDLQVLGVRRWSELVTDREKWRGIVRQAKAHSGLRRQQKKK
jgi:hypothetical protein